MLFIQQKYNNFYKQKNIEKNISLCEGLLRQFEQSSRVKWKSFCVSRLKEREKQKIETESPTQTKKPISLEKSAFCEGIHPKNYSVIVSLKQE